MNAEPERNSPEEIEARLTALLLGELAPAEARELEARLAESPHLRQLLEQLRATIDLVREVSASPAGSPAKAPVAPQLSPSRREQVLARFKTVTPAPFAWRARLKEWSVPAAAAAGFILLLGVGLRLGLSPRFQLAEYIDWSGVKYPTKITRLPGDEALTPNNSRHIASLPPGPRPVPDPPAASATTPSYSNFEVELPRAAGQPETDQGSLGKWGELTHAKVGAPVAVPPPSAQPLPAWPNAATLLSASVGAPSSPPAPEAKVPLLLSLPAAAFKGTPTDLADFAELGDMGQDKRKAKAPPVVADQAGVAVYSAPSPTARYARSADGREQQAQDASRAKTPAHAPSQNRNDTVAMAAGNVNLAAGPDSALPHSFQYATVGGLAAATPAAAPSQAIEQLVKEKSTGVVGPAGGGRRVAGEVYSDTISANGRPVDRFGVDVNEPNQAIVQAEPGLKPGSLGEEAAKRDPASAWMLQESKTRAPSEPGMASGKPPTTTGENAYLADGFTAGNRLTPTAPSNTRDFEARLAARDDENRRRLATLEKEWAVPTREAPAGAAKRRGVVSVPGDAADDDTIRRQILPEVERESRLAVAPVTPPAATDASQALGWKADNTPGNVPVVGDTPLIGRFLRPGAPPDEAARNETFRSYPGAGAIADAYLSIDPETRRVIANGDPGPASPAGTRTSEAGTSTTPVPDAAPRTYAWANAGPRLQNEGFGGMGGGGGMRGGALVPIQQAPPPGKPEQSVPSIDPATGLPLGQGAGFMVALPARAGNNGRTAVTEPPKGPAPIGDLSGSQVDPATGLPVAAGNPASQQAPLPLMVTNISNLDSNGRVAEAQDALVESIERPRESRPAPALGLVERASPPAEKAGLLGRLRSALSPTANDGTVVAFGRSENGPATAAKPGAWDKPAAAKAETGRLREVLREDRVLGKVVDDLDLAKASGEQRGNATQLSRQQAIAQLRDRVRVDPVAGGASARVRVTGTPPADSVKLAKKLAEAAVAFDSESDEQVAQQVVVPPSTAPAQLDLYYTPPPAPAPVAAPAPPSAPAAKVVRPADAPVPEPEVTTAENAFSTFSLNISDVSFKLAAASLENGKLPPASSIRSEEFINAFDYRDPAPAPGVPVGFAWERAAYPFAQNRDVLRFSIKTAAQGREAGRPLNLVVLLDHSGSMERADRVGIIREALRVLVSQLQPADKLSIVTFARTAQLRADGVSGPQAAEAAAKVEEFTPEGGTNLEEAMNLAYQTALRHYAANGVNRVVLLTDGAANLGEVSAQALERKVEAHRQQGVALDCFGIGWEGYNDDLLETLTRHGDGRYGFVNSPEEAASGFAAQLAGALEVAASDMKVQVEFNPARVSAYRQVGYAKHQLTKEQFRDNSVRAAQVASAESGNALYVVAVDPAGSGPLATVRARYRIPGTTEYREHAWEVPFTGNAAPLEQASAATRLAVTAATFSEWLAASPFADSVELNQLPKYLRGVPEVYGVDGRPRRLESMIREAGALGR